MQRRIDGAALKKDRPVGAFIRDVVQRLLFPFVRLGGRIFGGFDIDLSSPIDSLKSCKLPVIFFHGDEDAFVPYEMSVENYNACSFPNKKLVTIRGAGHGLCYPVDPEKYLSEMREFFDPLTK